jgi:hypothetical protein
MQLQQRTYANGEWSPVHGGSAPLAPQLVLAFAEGALLDDPAVWATLHSTWPTARIVACSTAGEIAGTTVRDGSLVATAIAFAHSHVEVASVDLDDPPDSDALGRRLAERLPAAGLRHVFVLSDGLAVNGSALVQGMNAMLPREVAVTGGLSGDGPRFVRTSVCVDGPEPSRRIVAIGFYGEHLTVGYGCYGGWDAFGVERHITKAEGNVLHELDGEPVLDLYKRYLGEHAAGLPASGLRFPLAIRGADGEAPTLVRTLLSIDEDARTMTFAGDVPVGHRARLMMSNVERLIDGADVAGRAARLDSGATTLALLVSCVGRKLVLGQRVEEEVEAVHDALGPNALAAGFYSYGELSPSARSARCDLHNQTITVTTLAEA